MDDDLEDDDEDESGIDERMDKLVDDLGTDGVIQHLRAFIHREFPHWSLENVDLFLGLDHERYGEEINLKDATV